MKYSDLLSKSPSETEIQKHLADGDQTAITIRIPKNLKDAAMDAAEFKSMSFTAYTHNLLVVDLSSGR